MHTTPLYKSLGDADSHNNLSQSWCKLKYKAQKDAKYYKALGNTSIVRYTNTLSGKSEEGVQTADVPGDVLYDKTAILALYNYAAKFYNSTTSTVVANKTDIDAYRGHRLLLQEVNCKLRLMNQTLSSVEIDIYLVHAKNTTSSTRTPRDLWNDGLEQITPGTYATANTTFTPFEKPTTLKIFNMAWRVLHKKRLTLEPGREHQANFSFKPNRIFDMEYTELYDHFKGITTRWMIVTRGTLGDTNNTVGTVGDITLGPSKYIGYQDIVYKSKLLSPYPKNYNQVSNWDTSVTNLYAINDESGARQDINV